MARTGLALEWGNLILDYARNCYLKQQLYFYPILGFALSEALVSSFCVCLSHSLYHVRLYVVTQLSLLLWYHACPDAVGC